MEVNPMRSAAARRFVLACAILVCAEGTALAQTHGNVVRDNTLNPGSRGLTLSPPPVGPGGPPPTLDIQIPATFGETHGRNLFHSFSQFNLTEFDTATFSGPSAIRNVFVRVTGGQSSSIDGTLRSTLPNASFFLVNPQGVAFGPNAVLDVKGSFTVTSADVVKFRGGGSFSASTPNGSVLTSAPPAAFGFLGNNPGTIDAAGRAGSSGVLGVPANKNLSFVGGDVKAGPLPLSVPGGQLSFVSVKTPRDIPINSGGPIPQPQVADPGAGGGSVKISALGRGITAGGVYIRAGDFTLGRVSVEVQQTAGNTAGGIDLEANNATINDIASLSISSATARPTDKGGNIFVHANTLKVQFASSIDTSLTGPGTGGNVFINVTHGVELDSGSQNDQADGSSLFVGSSNVAGGRGGALTIKADTLRVDGVSFIGATTRSPADGGSVNIAARRISLTNNAGISGSASSSGRGGDVTVTTHALRLADAQITAETSGSGHGGRVNVNARRFFASGTNIPSGVSASSRGPGTAGDVVVTGGSITLQSFMAAIVSSANGTGAGGSVRVMADDLSLSAGGTIGAGSSLVRDGGAAGSVTIDAKTLHQDASTISSLTSGRAPGGTISINADQLFVTDSSTPGLGITASSNYNQDGGPAGDVRVRSRIITLIRSDISSTTSGQGNGGMVDVSTKRLAITGDGASHPTGVLVNSTLNAQRAGSAGAVSVRGDVLTLAGGGQIASGGLGSGDGGTVNVRAHTLNIDGAGSAILTDAGTPRIPALGGGQGGAINVRGEAMRLSHGGRISSANFGQATGGDVRIRGDALTLADGGIVDVNTGGSREGGKLSIRTNTISATGAGTLISATTSGGTGMGGDIHLQADTIDLLNGAHATASTSGAGQGGTMTIGADELNVSGRGALITADARGAGNGGNVSLDARVLQILHGGQINASTTGAGAAGNVSLHGGDLAISGTNSVLRAETSGAVGGGAGGDVMIRMHSATITKGGRIDASTAGSGRGGNVAVGLTGTMTIDGAGQDNGIAADTEAAVNGGAGGNVALAAPRFVLVKGARLSANTFGSGSGGSLSIRAGSAVLDSSKIAVESTFKTPGVPAATGNAGSLVFRAAQGIELNHNSSIAASSFATNGGSISVFTPTLDMLNSKITVQAKKGGGGDITLGSRVRITLFESSINAQALTSLGNITIDPIFLVLNRSQIVTTTPALGNGNIDIQTQQLLTTPDSSITAAGKLVLTVLNPGTDIAGSLARLPSSLNNGELILQPQCSQTTSVSTFLIQGRGSVSDQPGAWSLDPGLQPDWASR